jgi:hypothetical protein
MILNNIVLYLQYENGFESCTSIEIPENWNLHQALDLAIDTYNEKKNKADIAVWIKKIEFV